MSPHHSSYTVKFLILNLTQFDFFHFLTIPTNKNRNGDLGMVKFGY